MKSIFQTPSIELITFDQEDIIVTSVGCSQDWTVPCTSGDDFT